MIGTTLKKLLDERDIKVNEFARQIQVPAQTLYSIIRRDNMKIDLNCFCASAMRCTSHWKHFAEPAARTSRRQRSGRRSGSCAVWMTTAAL